MEWYLKVLKNYANFQGRAHRTEYWMFTLIHILILFVLYMAEVMMGIPGVLSFIYSLALFVPMLAVACRRLHDTGRSGWWILISFVPVIGPVILLIFVVLDSENRTNQYGPVPK